MINLPFIKKKKGAQSQEPMADRTVDHTGEQEISDHVMHEMMDAIHNKDAGAFRSALHAHIANQFDWSKDAK